MLISYEEKMRLLEQVLNRLQYEEGFAGKLTQFLDATPKADIESESVNYKRDKVYYASKENKSTH